MSPSSPRRAGQAWFTFAGILFLIVGVSNLLWGIGALDKKDYLPKEGLLVSNLSVLGTVSLIWAAMTLVTGVLLLTRNAYGAGFAMVVATLSALFWLFAIPVLPIWSLIVISLDVLIIYHLAIHLDDVYG